MAKKEVRAKKNRRGGVDPTDEASLRRAEAADLITLPPGVPGTNCANCMWAKPLDTNVAKHWCVHEKVNLPITPRMCCKWWDNAKVKRPWEK